MLNMWFTGYVSVDGVEEEIRGAWFFRIHCRTDFRRSLPNMRMPAVHCLKTICDMSMLHMHTENSNP